MDIFVEPVRPKPDLVILGAGPVAEALRIFADRLDFRLQADAGADPGGERYMVVATQGKGDLDALKAALGGGARYVAFVGSGRKFATLAERLAATGVARTDLDAVSAPAGLNIHAITPEEIALSILAEITAIRRQRQRQAETG